MSSKTPSGPPGPRQWSRPSTTPQTRPPRRRAWPFSWPGTRATGEAPLRTSGKFWRESATAWRSLWASTRTPRALRSRPRAGGRSRGSWATSLAGVATALWWSRTSSSLVQVSPSPLPSLSLLPLSLSSLSSLPSPLSPSSPPSLSIVDTFDLLIFNLGCLVFSQSA